MCKHVPSLGKPAVCERMCHDFDSLDWRGWKCKVHEKHAGGLWMISITLRGLFLSQFFCICFSMNVWKHNESAFETIVFHMHVLYVCAYVCEQTNIWSYKVHVMWPILSC